MPAMTKKNKSRFLPNSFYFLKGVYDRDKKGKRLK